MKTDERNKFAIKSFLGEYLDLKKDKDNELATVDSAGCVLRNRTALGQPVIQMGLS